MQETNQEEHTFIALGKTAEAARAWADSERGEAILKKDALRKLMEAMSALSRVSLSVSQPTTPDEMIELLREPTQEWLGIGGKQSLLETYGSRLVTSRYAEQILDEAGITPELERAQSKIGEVRKRLRHEYEGASAEEQEAIQSTYCNFREGLITQVLWSFDEAYDLANSVGLVPPDLFTEIPSRAVVSISGQDGIYPCPVCGRAMRFNEAEERLACASDRCLARGARFSWNGTSSPTPLGGKMTSFRATDDAEYFQVRRGIWLYTVLPGLVELDLRDQLSSLADVQLWPEVDAYDLHVERGNRSWRVDVKDWRRADLLLERLRTAEWEEEIWIVVPDDRDGQVQLLENSSLPRNYRFSTASDLVSSIRPSRTSA